MNPTETPEIPKHKISINLPIELPPELKDRALIWSKRFKRTVVSVSGSSITFSCDECPSIWHTKLNSKNKVVSGGLRCPLHQCTSNDGFRKRPKAPKAWVPRLSWDHYR